MKKGGTHPAGTKETLRFGGLEQLHGVTFAAGLRVWGRVAALFFGGPAGQIAVMHRILVVEQRWIGEQRFLHALSSCTLLQGPEARQLAISIGWLMHGVRGGVAAGTLFVLPGAVCIMALSLVYAAFGHVAAVGALFFGLFCRRWRGWADGLCGTAPCSASLRLPLRRSCSPACRSR